MDPPFFVKRKANKTARREIAKGEQNILQYSHLGEILSRKKMGGFLGVFRIRFFGGARGFEYPPLHTTHHYLINSKNL